MTSNVTIYDISEKAGVSIATVSRVLNGSSRVSETTKQKVLNVMKQYDYTPNAFARGLGLNTMKTIGLMCADSSDLYLAKAVYFLEQLLRANGYDSILCCTGYDLNTKQKCMNLLLSKKVDSIILVGSNFVYNRDDYNQYIIEASQQIPVMLLNASLEAPNVYSIASDDYSSVYEATKQMLLAGIQDILFFYNSTSYSSKRKIAGFQAAMRDAGLSPSKELMQFYEGSREDISAMKEHLANLCNNGLHFDGVVAADDNLALGALKYALSAGLKIPEDISIIGYNNSLLACCCEPELTSIDNKLENLCQHLITTLMELLNGNEMPKQTVFKGEIIHRGTTAFK